jgi:hypothetical protein
LAYVFYYEIKFCYMWLFSVGIVSVADSKICKHVDKLIHVFKETEIKHVLSVLCNKIHDLKLHASRCQNVLKHQTWGNVLWL